MQPRNHEDTKEPKHTLRVMLARLSALFSARQRDGDLDDEIQAHLDLLTHENVRRGMTMEDARVAARREFGGVERIKETCREQRGLPLVDGVAQDLRYAFRTLRKDPGFTVIAIASLTIGIGGATVVATQLNAVFWKPLAVVEPEQLRILSWTAKTKKAPDSAFSYAAYLALREKTRNFARVACFSGVRFPPLAEWGPIRSLLVSGNYFETLGVSAVLGRTLTADDDRPGSPALVVVISHSLWQRVYGGTPDVLTRTVVIKGSSFRIVGVMPAGFGGIDPTDPREVMIPYAAHPVTGRLDPTAWNSCGNMIGRLHVGVSDEQARAEADVLLRDAIQSNPPKDTQDARMILTRLTDHRSLVRLRERVSTPLLLLLSSVSVILLIVCANLAGLLLARGHARRKEIATRLALGAPRGRVVRQLLTESLVLALAGGAAGIGLAFVLSPALPGLLTKLSGNFTLSGAPGPPLAVDLSPNLHVLAVSGVVTLLTGILFGVLPALRTSRLDLVSAMKQTSAVPSGGGVHWRSGKALVVVQVACSMSLLIGAGLLIQTFLNLRAVPVGYEPDRLLFVTIDPFNLPRQFVEQSVSRLQAVPGVTAATASMWPLYNNGGPNDKLPICVAGAEQSIDVEQVFPRFFETWGVRFKQGEDFAATAGPVAIVNEAFATKFFVGQQALGQTIATRGCGGTSRTIVGVVANSLDRQRAELVPMVYVPYPSRGIEPTTLALRTAGDPRTLLPAIRRIVGALDTRIDGDVTTGVDYRESRFVQERLLAGLLVCFGAIALMISCLGVYGLLAYMVSRRTPEVAVRMALGAQPFDVIGLIIRESLGSVVVGIVLGLIAALALTRVLESVLFGVSRYDPLTIAAATMVLALTATAAAFVPARRASRTDPMSTLRYE